MAPATRLEVGYGRQDSRIDLDRSGGKVKLSDLPVNYWQIGAVRGLPMGRVVPCVAASLGINHLSPAEDVVEVDGGTRRLESSTRFAAALGIGFQAFLGGAERIGVRGGFRALTTLYDTSSSFRFGSGGSGLGFSGSGV